MQETTNKAIVEQGSDEWHALRLGKFTASEISRIVGDCKRDMTEHEFKAFKEKNPKSTAKTCVDDNLLTTTAMKYVTEVASERETGIPATQFYENDAMRWGKAHEPYAKQLYAAAYEVPVLDAPFVQYKEYAGASPDGLIGPDIGAEIKCPISPAVHMQYRTLANYADLKELYANHYWQCVMGLLATGRKSWKFISFHPNYPVLKRLKIIDVPCVKEDLLLLETKLINCEKACQFLVNMK